MLEGVGRMSRTVEANCAVCYEEIRQKHYFQCRGKYFCSKRCLDEDEEKS